MAKPQAPNIEIEVCSKDTVPLFPYRKTVSIEVYTLKELHWRLRREYAGHDFSDPQSDKVRLYLIDGCVIEDLTDIDGKKDFRFRVVAESRTSLSKLEKKLNIKFQE